MSSKQKGIYFVMFGYIIFGLKKSSIILLTEDFYKPKIIYTDIAQRLSFAYTAKGEFLNNSAYFFSSKDENLLHYLLGVLNSALIDWYYRTVSVQLGEKAVRLFSIYVLKIPIPQRIITIKDEDEVLKIYGLSDEEVQFIRDRD